MAVSPHNFRNVLGEISGNIINKRDLSITRSSQLKKAVRKIIYKITSENKYRGTARLCYERRKSQNTKTLQILICRAFAPDIFRAMIPLSRSTMHAQMLMKFIFRGRNCTNGISDVIGINYKINCTVQSTTKIAKA